MANVVCCDVLCSCAVFKCVCVLSVIDCGVLCVLCVFVCSFVCV